MYETALVASFNVDDPSYSKRVNQLQASIRYTLDDLTAANSILSELDENDTTVKINKGCVLYKENQFEQALQLFQEAQQTAGFKAYLSYNIALCLYRMRQYASSLKSIADIIERGIRQYPELSVGMRTEGIDVRSVGNSLVLQESAFVEAFNLKAAIEYNLKNYQQSRDALTDMPPRSLEELDPVTHSLWKFCKGNFQYICNGAFQHLEILKVLELNKQFLRTSLRKKF